MWINEQLPSASPNKKPQQFMRIQYVRLAMPMLCTWRQLLGQCSQWKHFFLSKKETHFSAAQALQLPILLFVSAAALRSDFSKSPKFPAYCAVGRFLPYWGLSHYFQRNYSLSYDLCLDFQHTLAELWTLNLNAHSICTETSTIVLLPIDKCLPNSIKSVKR